MTSLTDHPFSDKVIDIVMPNSCRYYLRDDSNHSCHCGNN